MTPFADGTDENGQCTAKNQFVMGHMSLLVTMHTFRNGKLQDRRHVQRRLPCISFRINAEN